MLFRSRSCSTHDVAVHRDRNYPALTRSGISLGARTLFLHQRAETILIDSQTLLGCHFQREINRETECVMQRECGITGKSGGPVKIEAKTVTTKDMSPEQRAALRDLLLAAREDK